MADSLTRSTDYPDDWESRRKQVYKRDEYQCQNCSNTGGPKGDTELHAHHVVPKSRGGSHNLSNLICLCGTCHSLVHGHPIGNVSKEIFNSSRSSSPNQSNDSNSVELDDVEEITFDLASYSTKATGHLSQLIISDSASSKEVLDSFADCYQAGQKNLLLAKKEYHDLLENCSIGQRQTLMRSEARIESYRLLIDRCENLLNKLSNVFEYINRISKGSDEDFENHRQDIVERFDNVQKYLSIVIISIVRAVLAGENRPSYSTIPGTEVITKDWPYCPACGLEFSIWADGDKRKECILCESEWKKRGIIRKKWACTNSIEGVSITNEKRNVEGWESVGEQANEQELYQKFVDVQREEIARLASYVTNILVEDSEQ